MIPEILPTKLIIATPENKTDNIIIKVENIQKDKWTIANFIACVSVVVSAILCVYTYRLFSQAIIQSIAAMQSAAVADSVFRVTKTNDSSSLKKQDSVIGVNQKQFEIENRPYLKAGIRALPTFIPNGKADVIYGIDNLGKLPVRMIHGFFWVDYGKNITISHFRLIKDRIKDRRTNRYMIKETKTEFDFTSVQNIPSAEADKIKNGEDSFYFWGEIRYINLVSGDTARYEFLDKIMFKPVAGDDLLYNKNEIIHKR